MELRDVLVSIPDIDHEIIDWLAEINSYKGVCTVNSCAGHNDHKDNQPFVVLAFFKGCPFHRFCRELSPNRSDGPTLTLWPNKSWIAVFPSPKHLDREILRVPPERLLDVRRELFERVIKTLERVIVRKASDKEIEAKLKVLKI